MAAELIDNGKMKSVYLMLIWSQLAFLDGVDHFSETAGSISISTCPRQCILEQHADSQIASNRLTIPYMETPFISPGVCVSVIENG